MSYRDEIFSGRVVPERNNFHQVARETGYAMESVLIPMNEENAAISPGIREYLPATTGFFTVHPAHLLPRESISRLTHEGCEKEC
jgi:hypothetical protein